MWKLRVGWAETRLGSGQCFPDIFLVLLQQHCPVDSACRRVSFQTLVTCSLHTQQNPDTPSSRALHQPSQPTPFPPCPRWPGFSNSFGESPFLPSLWVESRGNSGCPRAIGGGPVLMVWAGSPWKCRNTEAWEVGVCCCLGSGGRKGRWSISSILNSRLQGLKDCNRRADMEEMNSQVQLCVRIKHGTGCHPWGVGVCQSGWLWVASWGNLVR